MHLLNTVTGLNMNTKINNNTTRKKFILGEEILIDKWSSLKAGINLFYMNVMRAYLQILKANEALQTISTLKY